MKKNFIRLTLLSSFLFALVAVPVAAMDSAESTTTTTPTAVTSSPPATSDDSSGSSDTSTSGRTKRVDDYKKQLKDSLTAAMKVRIEGRCEGAQARVKGKTTANTAITTARTKAYGEIVTNLQALSTAVAAKGVDVTTLQSEITMLQTKIAAFTTANKTYQQALTDLGALDCKTDPTGFKAALEVARTDQLAVFAAAKDVRTYVNDTIKPTLKTIKTSLEAKQ